MIRTLNPTTGKLIHEYAPESPEQTGTKIDRAARTWHEYRKTTLVERASLLQRTAGLLDKRKNELAALMTLEMGKPIVSARQEIEKCAAACKYYAENGPGFLAEEHVPGASSARCYVRYDALGPILAVMPWNFPFWQVFRFAAPALMAGNVALLKHASNVPQCALAIESLFADAGFPHGCFTTLMIESKAVHQVIENPAVAAVTLTGSVEAGRNVARTAGACLKKTVLELGGSDPFIVMPSADLEAAAETAVRARIINNGQSCVAAKRFIVDSRIADEFESLFSRRMASLKVGDPSDPEVHVGPLATEDVLRELSKQVEESIAAGAKVLTGARRLPGPGFYYAPTVLANIPRGCPADQEEIFGPVASLFQCRGIAEALEIANRTVFGLGSCLWTEDASEREFFVQNVEAGCAFVNGMVASDPRLPFGGIKESGYGRELSSFGMREFVNIKTVCVESRKVQRPATE